MKPVTVSIDTPVSPEEVFDFLDVMRNHEPFTDHFMREWRYSGPDRGVGSSAAVTVHSGGRTEHVDIVTVAAERPSFITERNTGARGRRVATGTYRLAPIEGGGTRVSFEYAWETAPASERMAAPLVRAVMRRYVGRALKRLAEQLLEQRGAVRA